MFDSVYFLLKHKAKLGELCDALAVSRLTTSNLQYLEEYEKLMAPIASTLDFLQKEENHTFGCLIPSLMTLSTKLKKTAKFGNLVFLKAATTELEEKLKERFLPYFTLDAEADGALIAAVLSPNVKMR